MVEVPVSEAPTRASNAELVRSSFALLADRTESIARVFYATLFAIDPPTRDLFPATMTTQRERLVDSGSGTRILTERETTLRSHGWLFQPSLFSCLPKDRPGVPFSTTRVETPLAPAPPVRSITT